MSLLIGIQSLPTVIFHLPMLHCSQHSLVDPFHILVPYYKHNPEKKILACIMFIPNYYIYDLCKGSLSAFTHSMLLPIYHYYDLC